MAKQDLTRLMEETGHKSLELDDVTRIGQLVKLAELVSDPDASNHKWLVALPRKCGNRYLEPMTIGKALWFEAFPLKWFPADDGAMLNLVLGYVLSRDVSTDDLCAIENAQDCVKAVVAWWRKCEYTGDQFNDIIKDLLPTKLEADIVCSHCNQAIPQKNVTADYGPVIRMLTREYGGTPHYWMHEENMLVIENLINAFVAQQSAEFDETCKQMKKLKAPLPTRAALVDAVRNYRNCLNDLRETWLTKR
jgi:hypothetical protein